jgi:hypothetical protein
MRALLSSLLERLRPRLASPRAALGVVAASTLVVASSLANGLAADDHWQRGVLDRRDAWATLAPPWYQLFSFFDGGGREPMRSASSGHDTDCGSP